MPLRLLRYMLRVWEASVSDGATRLPVIIPVVLHHSDTGWRAATRFEGLFDLPAAAAGFTPHFGFVLDDLGAQSEAALHARTTSAFTRLVLAALQQARSGRDLGQLLRGWAELMRELLRAPDGRRALRLIFRYLFEVRGAAELAAIERTASELESDKEEIMQTIAQMLEARGMEKGLEQGLKRGERKGQRELLLRLLQRRFGELPAAVHERVAAAESEQLERWADALLQASCLDEVFAAP